MVRAKRDALRGRIESHSALHSGPVHRHNALQAGGALDANRLQDRVLVNRVGGRLELEFAVEILSGSDITAEQLRHAVAGLTVKTSELATDLNARLGGAHHVGADPLSVQVEGGPAGGCSNLK